MARTRRYLDVDVLTAARKRMRALYRMFDHVVVGFSGGKDSLVVLALAREAATAAGRLPVEVQFYDEELIPDNVLSTVDHYRQQPWVRLHWLAFPLESNKFILGRSYRYVQWDPKRTWLRQPPAWAVQPEPGELGPTGVTSQYHLSQIVANRWYPGRVTFALGLRASESLLRLRACLSARHHAWLVGPEGKDRVSTSRPIYDWNENDVLKYIMDEGLVYSSLYDAQHLVGRALRVSTPLHSEAAKTFTHWRAIAPVFYQQLIDLFPEMTVQERYWKDVDQAGLHRKYAGRGWAGIEAFVNDTYEDPPQRMLAFQRMAEIKDKARLRPSQFPFDAILRYFVGGTLKRAMLGSLKTGTSA